VPPVSIPIRKRGSWGAGDMPRSLRKWCNRACFGRDMPRLQLPVRSMRAVASSSFATHARTFAFLALSARTLLRMRRSTTDRTVYLVNQHILLHSRARISASGLCLFASLTPHRGVGGAPRDVRVLGGTPVGVHITRHARRLARRLASHDAGRSPLGAPPWRFWAPGPRFSVTGIRLRSRFGGHPDPSQRAPRSQVVVPDGRGPGPPRGQRLQAATAGRHTSLRLQDVSGRRPSKSEDATMYHGRYV
jgi:hypothetical protein